MTILLDAITILLAETPLFAKPECSFSEQFLSSFSEQFLRLLHI